MFQVDEARQFPAGQLGSELEVSYAGASCVFRVVLSPDGTATAHIPAGGDRSKDPFDIESALKYPACAASFEIDGSEYRVHIANRSQLYAVVSIALNHLNWHDESRIEKKYRK